MPVDQGLAQLSDNLLFATVLAYVVAMLGYVAEFAFGPLSARSRRRSDRAPATIAGGAVDTLPETWTPRRERRAERNWATAAGRGAVGLTVAGWVLHNASVVTRGLAAHRVPWGNMYEFSSVVCLAAVTAYLVLLTRQRVRYLGGFVLLPVILYLGLAGTVLYAPAGPLVPALNSYWLKIHTSAAMASSGIFMLGFVATVLYLLKSGAERSAARAAGGAGRRRALAGRLDAARAVVTAPLPAAERLDRVAYRITAFAFPVWTFAVIAGAIWAEAAWGRYWGWDPKETWAFITWVIYAGYLHARATAGWRGRRAAYIGILGFASLMVTYYAVNLWISGLHSYAGVG